MTHFIVIGRDSSDDKALERRKAAREEHMKLVNAGVESGQNIMAAALLNGEGQMAGSIMIVEFEDRNALDKWLEDEPYVTGNVWSNIEIIECKIPPAFLYRSLSQK